MAGRALSRNDIDAEPRVVRRRIDLYIYETLDEALTDFAPTLLGPLARARQIAVSHNPEKIRYACVSLRTVSLGVLELLAPTEEVKKWSSRQRDFYNGQPRTLTRLRFISHRIGSPELAKFMEADSQAVCQPARCVACRRTRGGYYAGFTAASLFIPPGREFPLRPA